MISPRDMQASFNGRPIIERYKARAGALDIDRSSFISHWKELGQFIQPRLGRFLASDVNKGGKVHQSIINSRATKSLRISTAGLIAGAMSPARPFFKLDPSNIELREYQPVKDWLETVEKLIREVLSKSNFYPTVSPLLQELLLFATGAMYQEDDFEDVARFYMLPAGSYMIAQDERQVVDTIVRIYKWPVQRLVSKFGLSNCSQSVQNLWSQGNYYALVDVMHFVGPNEEYDPSVRFGRRAKRWASDYFELATTGVDKQKFLSRGGFDNFPCYVPRWETTGDDVYGTNSPGMITLGDVKGLQLLEKRKAQAVEKMVNPPLSGPASLRNVEVSSLPGGLTIYDGDPNGNKLGALYEVRLPIDQVRLDIEAIERRIDDNFFVELFLAITNARGIQPKNQLELSQLDQERLLQLGPVLQQIHSGLLSPLIDRIFARLVSAELLPPPPPELAGDNLSVEYISPLAMAQRVAALEPIERLGNFVISLSQAYPTVLDKFDPDQATDEYAFAVGAPARVVVPDDVVAKVRQNRAAQQQQAQAMEMAGQAANVAKMASDAKTGDKNLLTDLNAAAQEAIGG